MAFAFICKFLFLQYLYFMYEHALNLNVVNGQKSREIER